MASYQQSAEIDNPELGEGDQIARDENPPKGEKEKGNLISMQNPNKA